MNIEQCHDYISRISDINQVLSSGERLLYYAVLQGDAACVQAVMDAGADPLLPGSVGLSAIDLARYLGRYAMLPALGAPPPVQIPLQLKDESSCTARSIPELEKLLNFEYLPFMRFADYGLLKQIMDDAQRARDKGYMYTERVYLGMTYRQELDSGSGVDVSIRWVDDAMGYGLFTEKPLRLWDLVGVYTGDVVKRSLFASTSDYCFRYPMGELYPKRYVIESDNCGNVTRFINHSDDANCTANACYYKGMMHMLIYAHRPIFAGQQLYIDYGAHYWGKRNYVNNPSAQG
jgi:hypothetical protein